MVETTEEYRNRINQLKTSIENEPYIQKMREDIAEGIYKTGNRQADIEEQFQEVIDNTTGKDVISAPELIAARNGEVSLKVRLDKEKQEVNAQLVQKASISYVDAILMDIAKGGPNSGPNGPFMSLAALNSYNFPDGKEGTWLVFDTSFTDGAHSFMWDSTNSVWKDLGVYQATAIQDSSIGIKKIDASLKDTLGVQTAKNIIPNSNFSTMTYWAQLLGSGSVSGNVLTFLANAQNGSVTNNVPNIIQNHKYYLRINLKANNTKTGLYVLQNSLVQKTIFHSGSDTYENISTVYEAVSSGNLLFRIADTSIDSWTSFSIKEAMVVDLSVLFGFGNEPSVEDFENLLKLSNSGILYFETEAALQIINQAKIFPKSQDNSFPNIKNVSLTNGIITVRSAYDYEKDIQVVIAKRGVNQLPDFTRIEKVYLANGSTENLMAGGSDTLGPYKIKVLANANGDNAENDYFTGGNHGYDNTGTIEGNSKTARNSELIFKVDGREVFEYDGKANYIDIFFTNYIQAQNTTKQDGSGREVLKEDYHIHYDGKKWTVSNLIEALEDIVITAYYGLQVINNSWNDKILYKGSANKKWNNGTVATNSMDKNTESILLVKGNDRLEFGICEKGLGKQQMNTGQFNAFTSTVGKTYNVLISGDNEVLMNNTLYYEGFYFLYSK